MAGLVPNRNQLDGSTHVPDPQPAPKDLGSVIDPESQPLLIDCDSCQVRPQACGDCVVSVLLGPPDHEWEPEEQRALEVLAESGLVPHLRLVPGPTAGGLPRGRRRSAG